MDAVGSTVFQPVKTVGLNEFIGLFLKRLYTLFLLRDSLCCIDGFTRSTGRSILSERLSKEGGGVFRIMIKNLPHVIGEVSCKNPKRTWVNLQNSGYRLDNALRGFRFTSLQARKIAFCDL